MGSKADRAASATPHAASAPERSRDEGRGAGEARIGPIPLRARALCPPLTGWSWIPFRLRAYRLGADLCFAPMIRAEDLVGGSPRAHRALERHPEEPWLGAQLVGRDPEAMAEAARRVAEGGIDLVDINLACTRGRPARRGEGAALLGEPARVRRIVRAVRRAAGRLPVTVKFRAGPDPDRITAPALARIAEEEGAAAVTVHGRTAADGLAGPVRPAAIARVRTAVRIPVIAQGGIRTAEDAERLLERTGAAACMLGRAAMRTPWLFRELRERAAGAGAPRPPDFEAFRGLFLEELEVAEAVLGRAGRAYARKSGLFYFRRLPGITGFRRQLQGARDYAEIRRLVQALRPDGWPA